MTLPISYAWTEVNILNETVTALNISGTVAFDVPGGGEIPGIGNEVVIDFVIRQRDKDRWNYLAGFNWEASKAWSFQAELGFGGSRSNAIASVTYRW